MKSTNLLENLQFDAENAKAQPMLVETEGRILRFALGPGQSIRAHSVPDSVFYVVVLQGEGVFTAGGEQAKVGPGSLLTFAVGEEHSVKAGNEPFIFVGFLQGAPFMRPERTGGELGREQGNQ